MQNTRKSLKINFIMNVILSMSAFLFPLITFPYVSRILKPEGMGKISFATSLITYFDMIAQLGVPTYGIRACAKVRDDKEKLTRTVHELFFINICMCVLAYITLGGALVLVPRLQEDRTLYIIVSATILFNAIGMEWLYKGLEQYTYITVRSILFKFIAVILMFILVRQKSDYVVYGGITIFAASASNILNFINLRKYIGVKSIGNYHPKKHLKSVVIFFAMACASTIYTNLDTVMLGFMKTNQDVGCYNASVRIKTILVSLITSLGAVLLPRASYYVENKLWDEFKNISEKALNFVFLLSVPLMVYFGMFAKQAIFFLSGKDYANAILPMQILMPTLLMIGITNILGIQMLVPLGKEKVVLYSEIAGAIIDLLLNAVLIPRFASSGAAIGTLLAEAVVFVVQFIFLKEMVIKALKKISYQKIMVAVILAITVSGWVNLMSWGSFVCLVVSAVLFWGVYGGVLLITREKFVNEIVGQMIKKIKRN